MGQTHFFEEKYNVGRTETNIQTVQTKYGFEAFYETNQNPNNYHYPYQSKTCRYSNTIVEIDSETLQIAQQRQPCSASAKKDHKLSGALVQKSS